MKKNDRALCDCEMEGMCPGHLLCEEQRLLQLYQRSLKSNKSKVLTVGYLAGLSRVYYDLNNYRDCILYGRKAEDLFVKLNIAKDERVDNIINILQSYLCLQDFGPLETFMMVCDKRVSPEHIPYKLLSQTIKERIHYHNNDAEGYLKSLREQRTYCHELKWVQHREEELLYLEARTLYWLKCYLGAEKVFLEMFDFQKEQAKIYQDAKDNKNPGTIGAQLQLDPKHKELWELIKRAIKDRFDIEPHPWNSKDVCYNCWKVGQTFGRCGGCHLVYFCSVDCQRSKWHSHRGDCRDRVEKQAELKDYDNTGEDEGETSTTDDIENSD